MTMPTTIETEPVPALPYATPGPSGPSVAAGVWVAVIGLGLIVLGGCFCVGILGLTESGGPNRGSGEWWVLLLFLYAVAAGGIGAGGWTVVIGLRRLLSVGR